MSRKGNRPDPQFSIARTMHGLVHEEILALRRQMRGKRRPQEELIHDLRLLIKKCRSFLRLLKPALSDTVFQRWNKRLRKTARRLSGNRDATVINRVLFKRWRKAKADPLEKAYHDVLHGMPAAWLAIHGPEEIDLLLSESLAVLSRFDALLAEMKKKGVEAQIVAQSFAADYRRERRLQRKMEIGGDTNDWHAWRRRTKGLMFQAALLEPVWPDRLRSLWQYCDRLQEELGKEHDLTITMEALERVGEKKKSSRKSVELVMEHLDRQRRKLRRRILNLDHSPLEERTRHLRRSLMHRWIQMP